MMRHLDDWEVPLITSCPAYEARFCYLISLGLVANFRGFEFVL